jgi:hypothetical protein
LTGATVRWRVRVPASLSLGVRVRRVSGNATTAAAPPSLPFLARLPYTPLIRPIAIDGEVVRVTQPAEASLPALTGKAANSRSGSVLAFYGAGGARDVVGLWWACGGVGGFGVARGGEEAHLTRATRFRPLPTPFVFSMFILAFNLGRPLPTRAITYQQIKLRACSFSLTNLQIRCACQFSHLASLLNIFIASSLLTWEGEFLNSLIRSVCWKDFSR